MIMYKGNLIHISMDFHVEEILIVQKFKLRKPLIL